MIFIFAIVFLVVGKSNYDNTYTNMNISTLELASYIWLFMAILVFVTLNFIPAPFGRHVTKKWGPSVNNKLGWFIMELPSLSIMTYFLVDGTNSFKSFSWILFALWIIHYFNRTFIYPLRIKSTPKKMPVVIVLSGIFFNCINASLNGYYIAELATVEKYDSNWIRSATFIFGSALFIAGMFINWKSDHILINLRNKGDTGYKIPQRFLFKYISAPNLFGEIIQWSGFALMVWNLPALTFMIWTIANLVPRAKNHHDWYHKNFKNYPQDRKAVIPFLY